MIGARAALVIVGLARAERYRDRPALELDFPFYEPPVFVLAVIVQAEVMIGISVRSTFDVLLTPVATDLDHLRLLLEMPVSISLNIY
jgi:hypothetical protein